MCTIDQGAGSDAFPYKTLGARLSNWGRWGADDKLGTLNFITEAAVKAAAACVQSGRRFELSIPIGAKGPQTGVAGRTNPIHLMNIMPSDLDNEDGMCVADDFIAMPLQSGTQWDGLAHIGYDGYFYNEVPASSVTAMAGAVLNGIEHALPGIVGRGVLLDVARFHDADWLPADHEITAAELDAVAAYQGVELRSGDVLLVRTGWRRKALVEGWRGWLEQEPGLGVSCAEWLHTHEIAAVASDNFAVEVIPSKTGGYIPLHCILIRDMGMMLGEIWDFEELALDCAADGRWAFFLSAPPLRVTGGIGSPVSPIAVK